MSARKMSTESGSESARAALVAKAVADVEKPSQSAEPTAPSSTSAMDVKAERRLRRKLDLHVYPILFLIFMMSFLDRINISNAMVFGMTEELHLDGNRFNMTLFVYFVPYILLEVPSNMMIRRFRPSLYLSTLMFCWGIINMCMGFVQSYKALIGLRFLLGAFEAGVLPGIIYLTSLYYKRHEFQTRMSFFYLSTLVAGAFGGLLAYAISELREAVNYGPWRWVFILEGAATALVSIAAYFLIVDWPEECRFLDPDEKALLKRRLAEDGAETAHMDTLNAYALKLIFTDWKIWLGSVAYMGVGVSGYAITFFMPTILVEFGWASNSAQVHTIPVYGVAAVGMMTVAYLSDRLRHRYGFIMLGCVISTVGYAMLLNQSHMTSDTKYAALFFVALGGYMAVPMAAVWLSNNMSGQWKRACGASIQITIGNISGIIGTNIFLVSEEPTYSTGYGGCLALVWLGALAATALFLGMRFENRQRDLGKRDHRLSRPEEEVRNMGDYHPSFRFTL